MRKIIHGEDTWEASWAGSDTFSEGQHNALVRFWCPAQNREVFGRLPGFAGEDFDKVTTEQLLASLIEVELNAGR